MTDVDVGPIDYLALHFPGARLRGEGMQAIVDLVDRDIITVLDLRIARRNDDGTITAVAITDLDGDGSLDLAVFDGIESGLLGDDDLADAAELIPSGDAVGVILYENTWARPFVGAMLRAGAQPIASGRIPVEAVIAALDELEAEEAGA